MLGSIAGQYIALLRRKVYIESTPTMKDRRASKRAKSDRSLKSLLINKSNTEMSLGRVYAEHMINARLVLISGRPPAKPKVL